MQNLISRKKTFVDLEVWELSVKVFSMEFGGMLHLATYDWFQAFCESFLRKIHTSYGSAKVFSLESLLLYGNLFEHTCIDNMDFIPLRCM